MVPVCGMPILWYTMKTYAQLGHTKFILGCGFKVDMIKKHIGFLATHGNLSGEPASEPPLG